MSILSRSCRTCIWRCCVLSARWPYAVTSPISGFVSFPPCPPFWPHCSFLAIAQIWPFFLFCLQRLFPVFFPSPTPFFTPDFLLSLLFFSTFTFFFPNYFFFVIKKENSSIPLLCFCIQASCWICVQCQWRIIHSASRKSNLLHAFPILRDTDVYAWSAKSLDLLMVCFRSLFEASLCQVHLGLNFSS